MTPILGAATPATSTQPTTPNPETMLKTSVELANLPKKQIKIVGIVKNEIHQPKSSKNSNQKSKKSVVQKFWFKPAMELDDNASFYTHCAFLNDNVFEDLTSMKSKPSKLSHRMLQDIRDADDTICETTGKTMPTVDFI